MTPEKFALLEARVLVLESKIGNGAVSPGAASQTSTGGGGIASDYEMSGEWGNPTVHKDPPRWKGASFAGCQFSVCPSDYLNELANFFDWCADRDEENGKTYLHKKSGEQRPSAPLRRRDAKLARGWAKRNEWKSIEQQVDETLANGGIGIGGDDIPFIVNMTLCGEWERP